MPDLDVIVEADNALLHGPPPDPDDDSINGPCTHCRTLTNEESEIFQEARGILEEIFKSSAEGDSQMEASLLDRLREKVSAKNNNLAKLNDSSEGGGCETLLHIAADNSHSKSMKILLEAGANPNATNRWSQVPLHTVVDEGDGCYCKDCNKKNAECVKLLLQNGAKTEERDWQGDTPLACSALCLMEDCARELWNSGASIHKSSSNGSKPGLLVASYIPDEVSRWFDAAITQGVDEKLHLELDFGAILGYSYEDTKEVKDESRFLVYISQAHRSAREKLLLHPLAQAYLHVKWNAVSPLFLFLRTAYLAMALVYTCFIVSFFLYNCPYEEALDEDVQEESDNETVAEGDNEVDPDSCAPTGWIFTMSGLLILFLICMIANEAYEMTLGIKAYVKNTLNIGWWFMIVSVTLNILPVYVDVHGHWQYIVAAFGIFLAWGMFMSQLARDPKIGIYVEMLGSVVREFLVFAATYIALLIGFGLGFAVLFPNNPMFEYAHGFLPLLKALMMMVGELDYETLFDSEENPRVNDLEYSIGAHIIYVGFIIVVTILLANLLIGLTTSDVQELKSKAELSRTERLVQQISLLETLFRKGWMPGLFQSWYDRHFSIHSILKSHDDDKDYDESSEASNRNDTESSDSKDSANDYKVSSEYKRPRGPFIRHFQPLRSTEDTLPQGLKEGFIRYIDIEQCSKKGKVSSESSNEFCDRCKVLLESLSKVTG